MWLNKLFDFSLLMAQLNKKVLNLIKRINRKLNLEEWIIVILLFHKFQDYSVKFIIKIINGK